VFPLKDNIPTDRFPVVTVVLIVANVLMYLFFQKALGGGVWSPATPEFDARVIEYGAFPYEFTNLGEQCRDVKRCGDGGDGLAPTWQTAFTSMFMHGSLLHIGGNMLFLWIFGNNVEDSMGRVKFLLFYVLGGLAALAGQTLVGPGSEVPMVGASGAVAAVLGGYMLLFPKARVVTVIFLVIFFTIIEIPALVMLGLWFVQQLVFGALGYLEPAGEGGGVAYFAHIGGFAFGLLLIKVFATRDRKEKPIF
jgi:membrane associated rhomboid family serine protease